MLLRFALLRLRRGALRALDAFLRLRLLRFGEALRATRRLRLTRLRFGVAAAVLRERLFFLRLTVLPAVRVRRLRVRRTVLTVVLVRRVLRAAPTFLRRRVLRGLEATLLRAFFLRLRVFLPPKRAANFARAAS